MATDFSRTLSLLRQEKGVSQRKAAAELGYPVLLRPSYVIGGQNMVIAHNDEDVRTYMEVILSGKIENPVLVDQYLMGYTNLN